MQINVGYSSDSAHRVCALRSSNFFNVIHKCLILTISSRLTKLYLTIINPQHMREGYGSRSVCLRVSVSVCYPANCYILLYVETKVPLGSCGDFNKWNVEFIENTLFKSYGNILWSSLPSSLLDELLMDKSDSDGLFSRRLACRTNDRSYNSTDSSLVTVDYLKASWLSLLCSKTADQARAWSCCILRNCVQMHMSILVVTLDV